MGYAIGAVVATIHDILTVGLFVLVDTFPRLHLFRSVHFMAPPILMIVGYSINDTIVVFDRIGEELELNPIYKPKKNRYCH